MTDTLTPNEIKRLILGAAVVEAATLIDYKAWDFVARLADKYGVDGSAGDPFRTLAKAVAALRAHPSPEGGPK